MKEINLDNKYECKICNKLFKNKRDLTFHIRFGEKIDVAEYYIKNPLPIELVFKNVYMGMIFNRWSIIGIGNKTGYAKCKCYCGVIKDVRVDGLKKGFSKSCGCYKDEEWIKRNTKYPDGVDQVFYIRWQDIKMRCTYNKNYIKKNIMICERWSCYNGYKNFVEDMYESYLIHLEKHGRTNTTLDRKDNDGNYEKDNCRWATRKQQANNSDRWK